MSRRVIVTLAMFGFATGLIGQIYYWLGLDFPRLISVALFPVGFVAWLCVVVRRRMIEEEPRALDLEGAPGSMRFCLYFSLLYSFGISILFAFRFSSLNRYELFRMAAPAWSMVYFAQVWGWATTVDEREAMADTGEGQIRSQELPARREGDIQGDDKL